MNKNFSLYLLIALIGIIIIPSVASVISQSNNINNTLGFQTSNRIKGTLIFKNKYKRNKGNKTRSENKIYSRNDIYIIYCTASVINTDNGNIGLTAAHCLHDDDGSPYDPNSLSFSPGYNGTNGPLGAIPVVDTAIPHIHLENPEEDDYALVRFAFQDPNREGATLQDYTGALGWRFDIGDDEPTSVFGYPFHGDMEDCARDGERLCKCQGIAEMQESFYAITNMYLGEGTSGSPFISQYDPETNLCYVYAICDSFLDKYNYSIGDIWDEGIFLDLLLRITP
ncbi:serine protease [Gigaspora margarita]|uniref:Serine protease n=1 Tax=Gigaspora margarita TaxID=4874 RepID=A0A8H3XPN9_GIGMA|nr:serine protease [Gigaspora margarita]